MGISMTPDQFYIAFVLGNYSDFKEQPDCIRRAFNAVVAASHMADHYYKFYKDKEPAKVAQSNDIGHFVEHVSKQTNGAFRDIRSIANAYKHLYTKTDPRSSISSAGTIEAVELENKEIKDVYQDYSNNIRNNFSIIYTKKTSERRELFSALSTVIGFWDKTFG